MSTPRRRRSRSRRRGRSSARNALVSALVPVVVLLLLALVTGRIPLPGAGTGEGTATGEHTAAPAGSHAEAVLAELPVRGPASPSGYSREQFGEAWADTNRNGCDTRDDVLARDLQEVAFRQGSCRVASGLLQDPYTGRSIRFRSGPRTSAAVQIDHVVALSEAWRTGAQQLPPAGREELANDPLNLLAVDGPTNQAKSDGDASQWLPERSGYRCDYVSRQIAVKKKYGLWVTGAEHDAMAQVLSQCPGQELPRR